MLPLLNYNHTPPRPFLIQCSLAHLYVGMGIAESVATTTRLPVNRGKPPLILFYSDGLPCEGDGDECHWIGFGSS